MESGINADQNFYSRRPLTSSLEQDQQLQQNFEPPPLPELELRSPQLPPKLPFLTTQNLQAVTANGFAGSALTGGGDPDDFYREYRGVQQSTNGYTAITTTGMPTASEARQAPSSLRSNGNGLTPKHPPLPGAIHHGLKPSFRSASSPIDDRTAIGNAKSTSAQNGYGTSRQQPSVKDLLKRFDQNNEQSSLTAHKPSPRMVTKDTSSPGYIRDRIGYQARTTASTQNIAAVPRTGVPTRDPTPGRIKSPSTSRSTQRTRFASEDQHSNNAISSTARPTRPRNVTAGNNSLASKSTTNLSPTTPNRPQSQITSRRPLFGEVVPIGQEVPDIGYGIPRDTSRRTSDSSLPPSWSHHRRKSEVEVSPSSPTAWYLGVTPALDDVDPNKPRSSPGHNRSHSDFADTRVNTMNGVHPSFNTTVSPTTSTSSRQASRIPVASKRFSDTSESSSLPSTRSNSRASSPPTTKPVSHSRYRKADLRPWSPAARVMTPTNGVSTPARESPRGKAKTPDQSTSNNASLKAYISASPPKRSPPLRSSRPRLPVSSASNTSLRQKVADRTGSPQQVRTGMKITRTGAIDQVKIKKISERFIDVGPVDFAARRAKIQRAYTKSIHESEQKEIRAANLKRLNERHTRDSTTPPDKINDDFREVIIKSTVTESPPEAEPSTSEPLHINTSFQSPNRQENGGAQPADDEDSPTLGIPGSFVDDEEIPQSAISTATGTTDIENEPQTEAPRLNRNSSARALYTIRLSSQILFSEDQFSPEQAMFGMANDNDDESIQIMLDATPVEETQAESTPTNEIFAQNRDASPPDAFQEVENVVDFNQPVFTSTLTTASPKETIPVYSRPSSPLEPLSQLQSVNEDSRVEVEVFNSYDAPAAPIISLPEETEYTVEQEAAGATSLYLPILRMALAPPSLTMNDAVQDSLNTPVTDMEYESSDGAGGANASEQEAYDLSNSSGDLLAPSRSQRLSHQSVWTDYSVETTDGYSGQEDFPHVLILGEPEPERKPTPPPKEESSISPVVPPKPGGYSPQPSPLFVTTTAQFTSPKHHHLPPLSTGEAFGLGLSDKSPGISGTQLPRWPDYSPPPPPILPQADASSILLTRSPPPPSLYNRRPPSSLYQSSHHDIGHNIESRRASDDLYSPRPSISTPRSSTQISLEDITLGQSFDLKTTVVESEEEKKVTEKMKKRLFQRRMLIKELIDTESVYLKDMNVVEEIYKGTAEACPKLDSNDVNTIFRNTAEIVAFSTSFLDELKCAGSSVYSPRQKSRPSRATTGASTTTSPATEDRFSVAATLTEETDEQKDRKTFIGANFGKHLKKMQTIYTDFLKNSELASTRLSALQTDGAVKVWLSECNLVAKDLTAAWDLDALLVKPVQRITRYQLLLAQIYEHTTEDHPDYQALQITCRELAGLLKNIDDLKKRIHMVGKIVGRKRKESDVRSGIAKAFGRRAERLQSNVNRPNDDEEYLKLHEKFGDDYLRLQVVMRDVEFYTRQTNTYVNDFLRYLSAMELVMRMSASPYPELESKWARFNMSMRDMGTVALEDHVSAVRQKVIEPFEQVIQLYGPPGLAMKKRSKRRLDYERYLMAKLQGKKIDEKLTEFVDQYEALNETLKLELPKLSAMTEKIGKVCTIQLVNIQAQWYLIWQEKVRVVLEESQLPKTIEDIIDMFARDYKYVEARAQELGIVNGTFDSGEKTRVSQSTQDDDVSIRTKGRPSNLSTRSRGMSLTSDKSPSLPTPDFVKRHSGQFTFSPIVPATPGLPQLSYSSQPWSTSHSRVGSGSPVIPDPTATSRPHATSWARPSTGRSFASDNGPPRLSTDYNSQHRRESGSTYNSGYQHVDGPPPPSNRPFSGLFQSALPDGPEDSQRSSRASSRDRNIGSRFNVLYLAASLFEFNIAATKQEAGYPYLTYQAGEIFDVIGEKGELWLAKNQDDLSHTVGWIWSKHFARLATD